MRNRADRGFTILEVALAIALGVALLASVATVFTQYSAQSRISQAKSFLATLRNNIAMYKYRTSSYPPDGAVGTITNVNSGAGQISVTDSVGGFPTTGFAGYVTQAGSTTATLITAVSGAPPTQVLTLANVSAFSSGKTVLSGIFGNVDDQGLPFLTAKAANGNPPGMGLGDPWTGFQEVRDLTDAANGNFMASDTSLPCFTGLSATDTRPSCNGPFPAGAAGFEFSASRGSDVWGGLAYNPNTGDIYDVLPDPLSANKPPAAIGFFPGDPPLNWGR
ncbi:MAG: type II secretion system GspH family protein [Cyanobacteria bacterium REEB65]|nr:type II secretion system GspH family protein [Cyanobacteria bacterium REEB65]